jgi:hypothetical protein
MVGTPLALVPEVSFLAQPAAERARAAAITRIPARRDVERNIECSYLVRQARRQRSISDTWSHPGGSMYGTGP